jgi:hypothetical protein
VLNLLATKDFELNSVNSAVVSVAFTSLTNNGDNTQIVEKQLFLQSHTRG